MAAVSTVDRTRRCRNGVTRKRAPAYGTERDSYTISIPVSPPPPQSISTYSRFMHDHTKRQMESFGAITPSGGSRGSTSSSAGSSLTNGVGPSEYH
ncbi:thiol-specific monooxygenase [Purpureocillium lavendulum]|uniref:Thiol-specific monooxygenase n=1 Tax=Purpureocillium lavendulum TaxID=1247861 RepID=A0AB34FGS0_9HYPO|nr:thiol-specific monooxygenase [Purpureocillium lavendulum]